MKQTLYRCVIALCIVVTTACSEQDRAQLSLRAKTPTVEEHVQVWERVQEGAWVAQPSLWKADRPIAHPLSADTIRRSRAWLRLSQSCARQRLLMVMDVHVDPSHTDMFRRRFLKAQQHCVQTIMDQAIVDHRTDDEVVLQTLRVFLMDAPDQR